MGKRSRERTIWSARDGSGTRGREPWRRRRPHTVRVYLCADCRARGCQLITCADGTLRCTTCKSGFDRQQALPLAGDHPELAEAVAEPSLVLLASQVERPPRVG